MNVLLGLWEREKFLGSADCPDWLVVSIERGGMIMTANQSRALTTVVDDCHQYPVRPGVLLASQ